MEISFMIGQLWERDTEGFWTFNTQYMLTVSPWLPFPELGATSKAKENHLSTKNWMLE